MAFFDKFRKVYVVKASCFNCGHTQDLKVPKGMVIDSYLRTEAATCENCGNPTLRRILTSQVTAPQNARVPKVLPPLPPLPSQQRPTRPAYRPRPTPPQLTEQQRRKLQQSRRPRPPYRPQVQQYPEDFQQEVEYPVEEPINQQQNTPEPEWMAKPKKINFWTGKEE